MATDSKEGIYLNYWKATVNGVIQSPDLNELAVAAELSYQEACSTGEEQKN